MLQVFHFEGSSSATYTIKGKDCEGRAGKDKLIGRWGETQEETEGHCEEKAEKKTLKKEKDKASKAFVGHGCWHVDHVEEIDLMTNSKLCFRKIGKSTFLNEFLSSLSVLSAFARLLRS